MYKTGIWRLTTAAQLRDQNAADIISYQLLKEDSEEVFEAIVKHLRLSSGIFRSTYAQRFADLDPLINRILRGAFSRSDLEVHDWAASDCRVSVEWAASLWALFPEARVIASDLLLGLTEVTRKGSRQSYILEPDGTPLQYIQPPFVVSLQKPIPAHYPLNRWLASRAKRRVPEAQAAARDGSSSNWRVDSISLIHPSARRLAAADSRFEVRAHSVFEPPMKPADVIRTMNIFNPGYFSEDRLRSGAACVERSLRNGGIWIVGRTTEETRPAHNSVSVFQKTAQGLALLERLNGGSEIEELVLKQAGAAQRPV
jgi:hypothetical protein